MIISLIHRSFSWVVAAACIFLAWKSRQVIPFRRHAFTVLFFVIMVIAVGFGHVLYEYPRLGSAAASFAGFLTGNKFIFFPFANEIRSIIISIHSI